SSLQRDRQDKCEAKGDIGDRGPALRGSREDRPSMTKNYEFYTRFARILNSGQSRSVVLSGNIHDLFWDGQKFVPLIPFLCTRTAAEGIVQVVYELNAPIRMSEADRARLSDAWVVWKGGADLDTLTLRDLNRRRSDVELLRAEFDQYLRDGIGNSTDRKS